MKPLGTDIAFFAFAKKRNSEFAPKGLMGVPEHLGYG